MISWVLMPIEKQIGKTQRTLKLRCQEHYQGTGDFWKKKQQLMKRLNEQLAPPIEDSPAVASSSNGGTNQQGTASSLPSRVSTAVSAKY